MKFWGNIFTGFIFAIWIRKNESTLHWLEPKKNKKKPWNRALIVQTLFWRKGHTSRILRIRNHGKSFLRIRPSNLIFFLNFRVEPETIALSDIVEIHMSCSDRVWDCMEHLVYKMNCSKKPIRNMEFFKNSSAVFCHVDACARFLFPLSFVLFNCVYWTIYMYILWKILFKMLE